MQAKIALDVANRERAAGEYDDAIRYYRSALAIDPSVRSAAGIGLGDTLLATGKPGQAAAAYQAVLDTSPGEGAALTGLGVAQLALNQPAAAVDNLQRGLAAGPTARGYRALAIAEDVLGQFNDGVAACRQGLDHFAGDQGLREDLGLSQALAGDFDAGISTLRAAAASPAATARDRLTLALALGLAGRSGEAARIDAGAMNAAAVRNNLAFYARLRALPAAQRARLLLQNSGG